MIDFFLVFRVNYNIMILLHVSENLWLACLEDEQTLSVSYTTSLRKIINSTDCISEISEPSSSGCSFRDPGYLSAYSCPQTRPTSTAMSMTCTSATANVDNLEFILAIAL